MKLQDHIEAYKKLHPNRDHTFKDGTIVKAKLHEWLDQFYLDCVKEFKTYGTKNNAEYL